MRNKEPSLLDIVQTSRLLSWRLRGWNNPNPTVSHRWGSTPSPNNSIFSGSRFWWTNRGTVVCPSDDATVVSCCLHCHGCVDQQCVRTTTPCIYRKPVVCIYYTIHYHIIQFIHIQDLRYGSTHPVHSRRYESVFRRYEFSFNIQESDMSDWNAGRWSKLPYLADNILSRISCPTKSEIHISWSWSTVPREIWSCSPRDTPLVTLSRGHIHIRVWWCTRQKSEFWILCESWHSKGRRFKIIDQSQACFFIKTCLKQDNKQDWIESGIGLINSLLFSSEPEFLLLSPVTVTWWCLKLSQFWELLWTCWDSS